jgi:cysteine desulfurase family protein (TIGR01976 family)
VYFDGPAGTQVPQSVIDAMGDYLKYCNANHDGAFATSRASDVLLDEAHRAVADLLGTPLDDGADCISFGPNMTTLTFALSRAIGRTWGPGDEVVVTRLDHDANVTPWVLAARDAGATVRYASFDHKDCSLNLDELRSLINKKTKLVAVGAAANVAGTVNPIAEICNCAHDAGAHVFVDAVHYVPHARTNIAAMNCDYLACSAYKFFGPHVGMMWGRRELLEQLEAYKVRPAADTLPGKWMTGTQNHEGIAGTLAAIEYLADIGRTASRPTQASGELDRRDALDAAYESIQSYERKLVTHLLAGLAQIPAVKVWGITDPAQLDKRLPTVAITHASIASGQLAQQLGERAIFTWGGNCYALQFTESLGLEPDGVVRIGLVHYNTIEEIDYLLEVLRAL